MPSASFTPGDVGEKDEGVGVAGHGAGGRHLVRVHVVVFAVRTQRDRGQHRQTAESPDGFQPARLDGTDFSHVSQVVALRLLFAGAEGHAVSAAEADGRASCGHDGGDQALVHDSGQHHQSDIASLGVGDAQAIYEIAFLAQQFEGASKRGAAAVHDGDLVAVLRQLNDGASALVQCVFVFEGSAAELDYDLHCRPSCSLNPYIRFMF